MTETQRQYTSSKKKYWKTQCNVFCLSTLGKEPKKLKYIEAYCPRGSQFLRNCTLLQCLPVQGFISKILSRGEGIVT